MTESSLNSKAKKEMVSRGIFMLKTNDNFTGGIPDNYGLHEGYNTWLEFKFSQDGTTIPDMARRKQLQLVTMREIRQHGGVAVYAGYVLTGKKLHLEIWDPLEIDPQDRPGKTVQNPAYGPIADRGYDVLEYILKGKSVWHRK